eukprot:TRINITY_DN37186_c0_g1_i2.p7 TRINITY_DN37186_c0_g1~~TRINITY_DN37186_c0_g1_i2.p7  ORF type:complete len:110 (-),score=17.76 TRINITY_DN37186_c0_g1_i2:1347-1676(-)
MSVSSGMLFALVGMVAIFVTVGVMVYFMILSYIQATRELQELRARRQLEGGGAEGGTQLEGINVQSNSNKNDLKQSVYYPSFLVENPYEQFAVAVRTDSCVQVEPNEFK